MKPGFFKATVILLAAAYCISATAQSTIEYDIVIFGGRVIDPETKLDTIKNIGIIKNKIAKISNESLKGKETILVKAF